MEHTLTLAFTVAFALYVIIRHPYIRRFRQLRSTPPMPIAALEPGTVRIHGRIEVLDEELAGALSGRACVHFEAAVSEKRTSPGHNGQQSHWVALHRVRRSVDFVVRDETGAVIVRIDRADIRAKSDSETRSRWIGEPSTAEAAFLERFGEDPSWLLGLNRDLLFSESALEVGEEVTVLGEAKRIPGPIPMVIVAPRGEYLMISDSRHLARL